MNVFGIVRRARRRRRSSVRSVEHGAEVAERESPDTERHLDAAVAKVEAGEFPLSNESRRARVRLGCSWARNSLPLLEGTQKVESFEKTSSLIEHIALLLRYHRVNRPAESLKQITEALQ